MFIYRISRNESLCSALCDKSIEAITDKTPAHPLEFLLLHGGCCLLFLLYSRGQEYLPVQGYLED